MFCYNSYYPVVAWALCLKSLLLNNFKVFFILFMYRAISNFHIGVYSLPSYLLCLTFSIT